MLIEEKRKAIYEFADKLVEMLPKLTVGSYRNDDQTLHFDLLNDFLFANKYKSEDDSPISNDYTSLKKTIVRYGVVSKIVEADVSIKDCHKDFQLFLIIWGFAHKLTTTTYWAGTIDEISLSIISEYGKDRYSTKNAVIELMKFLTPNQNNIKRIDKILNNNKHKQDNEKTN